MEGGASPPIFCRKAWPKWQIILPLKSSSLFIFMDSGLGSIIQTYTPGSPGSQPWRRNVGTHLCDTRSASITGAALYTRDGRIYELFVTYTLTVTTTRPYALGSSRLTVLKHLPLYRSISSIKPIWRDIIHNRIIYFCYLFFHRRPIQCCVFFPVGLSSLTRHFQQVL